MLIMVRPDKTIEGMVSVSAILALLLGKDDRLPTPNAAKSTFLSFTTTSAPFAAVSPAFVSAPGLSASAPSPPLTADATPSSSPRHQPAALMPGEGGPPFSGQKLTLPSSHRESASLAFPARSPDSSPRDTFGSEMAQPRDSPDVEGLRGSAFTPDGRAKEKTAAMDETDDRDSMEVE